MTPFTEQDLPEVVMAAMMRLEEEAYRAGQHGCCQEGASKMANPSCFGACDAHGPRARAALSLLCHALAEFTEEIVEACAREVGSQPGHDAAMARIRALAPVCPACRGLGWTNDGTGEEPCTCSRGKAYRHWHALESERNAKETA